MTLARLQARKLHLDGSLHPDFHGVELVLRDMLRAYPGGAAVSVYHRGERVVDLWGGYSDAEGTRWTSDTMAPSFSTTKGVAATLLHIYADRGLVDYDAKVAEYWPEFAQAGKADITVRHVLSHQSGLYHIRQMIDHIDRMMDWDHMIEAIERTMPAHAPGERTGYHGLTFGFLVGEILQRVSGKKFSDLVQAEIAKPLKLDGLYIGAPEKAIKRAAQLIFPDTTQRLSQTSLGSRLEIGDGHPRIAWSLHPQHLGVVFGSRLDVFDFRGIDKRRFDLKAIGNLVQQAIGSAVDIGTGDHMVAW